MKLYPTKHIESEDSMRCDVVEISPLARAFRGFAAQNSPLCSGTLSFTVRMPISRQAHDSN